MHSRLRSRLGVAITSVTVTVLLVGVGVGQARQSVGARRSAPAVATRVTDLMPTAPPPAPTTTAAPATTTTVAPPPVATPVPAPAPAPVNPRPEPAPPPPATAPESTLPPAPAPPPDGVAYAVALIREMVPAAWLAAVPVRIEVLQGKTSWSSWGGLIRISDWHLNGSVGRAKNVLAHEWGHQVAWRYGTDDSNGAPPEGFPYSGTNAQEMWADCVGEVLSGVVYPTGGLPPCSSPAKSFTRGFINNGPGVPLR